MWAAFLRKHLHARPAGRAGPRGPGHARARACDAACRRRCAVSAAAPGAAAAAMVELCMLSSKFKLYTLAPGACLGGGVPAVPAAAAVCRRRHAVECIHVPQTVGRTPTRGQPVLTAAESSTRATPPGLDAAARRRGVAHASRGSARLKIAHSFSLPVTWLFSAVQDPCRILGLHYMWRVEARRAAQVRRQQRASSRTHQHARRRIATGRTRDPATWG